MRREAWRVRVLKRGNAWEVVCGSVSVRLYRASERAGARVYFKRELRWTDGDGHRHREKVSGKTEAAAHAAGVERAATKARELAAHAPHAELHESDYQAYQRGVILCAEVGRRTDELLEEDVAVRRAFREAGWAEAFEHGFLKRLAAEWIARGRRRIASRSAAEALPLFLADKRRKKLISQRHAEDLQERIGVFARAFPGPLCELRGDEIERWLSTLTRPRPAPDGSVRREPLRNRTLNNYLGAVKNFFAWAAAPAPGPGLVDEALNLRVQAIESARNEATEVEIFTAEEMEQLLTAAAPAEFERALAIAAFAGLRSAELLRLDWREVKPDRGVIEVSAGKAKTAMRRLVPITPNLARWVGSNPPAAGRVWPHSRAYFHELQLATAAKCLVGWKHNALRHSFISYRLAAINDVNQVALEAGNSARMIHKHYRELVTASEAATWFSIGPATRGRKIVQGVFTAFAQAK